MQMSRWTVSWALVATMLSGAAGTVRADFYRWEQTASEDQVNNSGVGDGSTDSTASGHAEITYDSTTGLLECTVSWSGLEGLLTAIHVHGPATASQSVMPHLWNVFTAEADVVAAGVDRTTDTYVLSVPLTSLVPGIPEAVAPIHLQHMIDELGYVNIHSDLWPMGEIRANLVLTEATVLPTADHPKCINALNGEYAKVHKKAERELAKCVRDHAKSRLSGTLEDCLAVPKPRVVKAQGAVQDRYDGKCAGWGANGSLKRPPYGVSSATLVGTEAVDRQLATVLGVLGPTLGDVDPVVTAESSDKEDSKCQQKVLQAVQKCERTTLKEFNKCKKDGLRGKDGPPGADVPFDDATDLEACVGYDPKGKVARACDPGTGRIRFPAIAKFCQDASNLSALFPVCATGDPATLATCLEEVVRCNACLGLNAADALSADCDLVDDGVANASCS